MKSTNKNLGRAGGTSNKNVRLSDHEIRLIITSIEHCVSDAHYLNRLRPGTIEDNLKKLASLIVKLWGATSGEMVFPDSLVDLAEEHLPIYSERIPRKSAIANPTEK